jgi:DNA replicative helicase MCM subunit Mcm2 (Cdc46/Mcm family)
LNESLREEIRNYLNYVRTISCDIPNELQKKIQDDFVQMRKDSTTKTGPKIGADDLHRFLALSRLLAMSEGSNVLNNQHWEKAKSMEFERRERCIK